MSIFLDFIKASIGKEDFFLLAGVVVKASITKMQEDAVTLKIVDGEGAGRVYLLHYSQLAFIIGAPG
jgi:hypothetical protein